MKNIQPMVVAVWCGESKPNSVGEYFDSFVNEMNLILNDGIKINDFLINASIRCFIGDSPAKSFMKGKKKYLLHVNTKSKMF